MSFDRRLNFYWLNEGKVEITLNVNDNVNGTWRTMDNDKSAITGKHYRSSRGTFGQGRNKLEIPVYDVIDATKAVGLGIEATYNDVKVQTTVVLEPEW